MGCRGLGEGEDPVHDGANVAPGDEIRQPMEVSLGAHGAPEDLHLPVEHLPEIRGGLPSGGGPAGDDSSAATRDGGYTRAVWLDNVRLDAARLLLMKPSAHSSPSGGFSR